MGVVAVVGIIMFSRLSGACPNSYILCVSYFMRDDCKRYGCSLFCPVAYMLFSCLVHMFLCFVS